MGSSFEEALRAIDEFRKSRVGRPFIVSVMGQAGVGKSSLVNTLFGTGFRTGRVGATSDKVEQAVSRTTDGYEVQFYALPGIGVSKRSDEVHLRAYREMFKKSDVVLWAIHSDNQALGADAEALSGLIKGRRKERIKLINKIVFALTKADMLAPTNWHIGKASSYLTYAPDEETEALFQEKERYCQSIMLDPFRDLLVSRTYNDCNFEIDDPRFAFNEYMVVYYGLLDSNEADKLNRRYPRYSELISRLHDSHGVVTCSSEIRYNLSRLMFVIANTQGWDSVAQFSKLLRPGLDRAPLSTIRSFKNATHAVPVSFLAE